MRSRNAGEFDFEDGLPELSASNVRWTAKALPSLVTLTRAAEDLVNPSFTMTASVIAALTQAEQESFVELAGARIRIDRLEPSGPYAALLPLDRLFEIRVAAALRLWRALNGRRPGSDPGALTADRQTRFILALRALDARLLGTTYPDIAAGLFDVAPISKRDWISHELRDQTGRLVRLGFKLMKGGYRQLLVHPYRRRI
jgi:hypothetical protein